LSIFVDEIPIEITRKRVKNINIRITRDGEVKLSAHRAVPLADIERFVRSKEDWIRKHVAAAKNRADNEIIDDENRDELRSILSEWIDERLPYWEERMALKSSGYRIRDMRSRWGSCNHRTRMLCFNLKLALFDQDILDYVIVHELAHIAEANHGPKFWEIVATQVPDHKEKRKLLRNSHQ